MTLDECREHIGDDVVYTPGDGKSEDGVIKDVGMRYAFVLYRGDGFVKATAPEMLELDPHAGQLWANELQSRQRQVPSDREWS